MANYLLKRGKLWWVQRKFPVDVKDELGTFFRKSLGTEDPDEARMRMPARMVEFDQLVQSVRRTRDEGDLFDTADEQLSLAQMMSKYQAQVLSVLSNAAQLRHVRVLEGYGQFVGLDLPAPLLVARSKHTVDHWLLPKYGHTDAGRRSLNVLIAFFDWIVGSGYLPPPNPFAGFRIRPVKSVTVSRKAWTQEDLARVLESLVSEVETPSNVLARDNAWRLAWVVLLGHLSGETLHDICEARIGTQFKKLSSDWHRVRQCWPEPDPYWVPGLSPGGPDLRRSWQLQKAFGRRLKAHQRGLTYTGLRLCAEQGVPLDHALWLNRLSAVALTDD
ncbi:MAG: DUF6538 domain-containing protein [Litorivicinus sp.]|mgnify:CR=1 FL=1